GQPLDVSTLTDFVVDLTMRDASGSLPRYHSIRVNLFLNDFGEIESPSDRTLLYEQRKAALRHDCCRNLASRCYMQFHSSHQEQNNIRRCFETKTKHSPFVDVPACSWLQVSEQREAMPYYLWDTAAKKTREISEI